MNKYLVGIFIFLHFNCNHQTPVDTIQVPANSPVKAKNISSTLNFTSAIRAIFEDSNGNFWFGSMQEGVAFYNGNHFTYFTMNDGLSDHQIRSIKEDQNGNIWFGTANGVSSYDGKRITNHTSKRNEFKNNGWAKSENDLWFNAGIREGVYRFDGKEVNFLAFPDPKVINPNNLYAVTDISHGKSDRVWISTYAGVFGYDGKDFIIINDETLGLERETGELHIRSILEDSKGRLWIGNNGIGVLLREKSTTINFSEKNNLVHSSSLNRSTSERGHTSLPGTLEHVFTIAEGNNGNIWFGDRDAGVWKYNGEKMTNYTKKDGLSNDFAFSIFKDKRGEMWFGMGDGKVFKFNGKSFDQQF